MKTLFILIMAQCSIVLLFSCGTGEQVKAVPVAKSADSSNEIVGQMNTQLSTVTLGGFPYKEPQVQSGKLDAWAESAVPIVKTITDQMPAGYVLQITGHTDSRGPEEPAGRKEGNIKLSEKRALFAFNALVKKGLSPQKMKHKGVGSSIPVENASDDASQRRVTFMVVME